MDNDDKYATTPSIAREIWSIQIIIINTWKTHAHHNPPLWSCSTKPSAFIFLFLVQLLFPWGYFVFESSFAMLHYLLNPRNLFLVPLSTFTHSFMSLFPYSDPVASNAPSEIKVPPDIRISRLFVALSISCGNKDIFFVTTFPDASAAFVNVFLGLAPPFTRISRPFVSCQWPAVTEVPKLTPSAWGLTPSPWCGSMTGPKLKKKW